MPTIRPVGSKGAFATFGLGDNLLRAISEAGFEEPRPIQYETIPQVLRGGDVLGLAQTGTGKTAAFALPIIERLSARRGRNPRALILAPTRELALQTHHQTEALARYTDVRVVSIFGGVSALRQVRSLRARPDIIVACPGRLLDLLGSDDVCLSDIEVLVLDEADHMLDMGFLPDIKRILSALPRRRQNLLFSATMPGDIRTLTDQMLHDPHVVELAHSAPAETIEHAVYPVGQDRKSALLRHLINADDFRSAIVFLRTKHRARRLAEDLDRTGHRAIALQGNMSQVQRRRAMQGFRDGRYDVLVATDIAARGIDVEKISHVINFDVPDTPDAYTHRIGRTGRAERSGKAFTFVTHEDFPAIKAIERKLNMEFRRIKLPEFQRRGAEEPAERQRPARQGRWTKKTVRKAGASDAAGRGRRNGRRATARPGEAASSPAGKSSGSSARRPSSQSREGIQEPSRRRRSRRQAVNQGPPGFPRSDQRTPGGKRTPTGRPKRGGRKGRSGAGRGQR